MENYLVTDNGTKQVEHAYKMFSHLCTSNYDCVTNDNVRLVEVNLRGASIAVERGIVSDLCLLVVYHYGFIVAFVDDQMFEEVIIQLLYVG